MMIEYCTLFDANYFAQGLALYKSMDKHHANYRLHILAVCEKVHAILKDLNLPNVLVYSLADVETEALQKLHPRLKHFEYVCALKPSFMLRVLQVANHVVYIDADSYFFSTGENLIRSFREDSSIPLALTPHRFTPTRRHFLKNGEFNAGFIYATRDGIPCLKEWDRRCTENRTGRMTDQQCLNEWPKQWNAHIIKHKGLNLAPWNHEQYKYSLRNGQIYVENDPLIWYHFHQGLAPAYHLHEFISQHVYQLYKGDLQAGIESIMRELRAKAQAFREDTITIFTVPHRFDKDDYAVRQRNALNSWIRLNPRPEIILIGDDPGIKEAAGEFRCRYVPEVARDEHGIPVLSDAFNKAHQQASNEIICFVNTDIILFQDFMTAIDVVQRKFETFLMIGRRCVLDIAVPLDFSAGWERRLRQEVEQCSYRDSPTAIDYLVFSPGELPKLDMPPFIVGSPGWDNWVVAQYDKRGAPVVDASRDVICVHHHHPVAWPDHGVKRNRSLAQWQSNIITHSHWVLQDQDIVHRTESAALPELGLPKPNERPITFPLPGATRPVKLVSSALSQSYVAPAVVHARPVAIVVKPAVVYVEPRQEGLKNYCTYISNEQIVQFLAMYESMVKWCMPFKLWTLALDEPVLALLHKLKLDNVGLLPSFDKSNQNLRELKKHRSNEEYARTLKPLLLQHVMKLDIDGVTYLDTNGYFFSRPDSLYREIAAVNIAITPHRFDAGQNGEFNAGFMYFRKGEKRTFDCIVKWCDQVMTRCECSPGYFYEQKYLEEWPSRWGAHIIRHKGVNLAPWNQGSGQYKYEMRGSPQRYHLYVDNDPLIWYNFGEDGGYTIDDLIRQKVYEPYERVLKEARRHV